MADVHVLFLSDREPFDAWRDALAREDPRFKLHAWPLQDAAPEDMSFALAWHPPRGVLNRLPNLKAVLSLGAGIEHVAPDPDYPRDVPLVRLVDPDLTARMTEHVVLHVLYHHRQLAAYQAFQTTRTWQRLDQPAAKDRRAGIMGSGALSRPAAERLADLGFPVAAWSRTRPPDLPGGITHFAGMPGLPDFLARTDILVGLLPHTEDTAGLLSGLRLAILPRGAVVINAGRGSLIVEQDLLDALDGGHLAGASLDVFREEPLPAAHPFWEHPKIVLTPHCAADTDPMAAIPGLVDTMRRAERGEEVPHTVDFTRGY